HCRLPCCVARPPPPPECYPLSLHDALPICSWRGAASRGSAPSSPRCSAPLRSAGAARGADHRLAPRTAPADLRGAEQRGGLGAASAEHTSALQSRSELACRPPLVQTTKAPT